MEIALPRLLIAAPASGSGKTTLTCALLCLAAQAGKTPCAFKCGPDYIDPMFHREVLGVPSTNLDLFFLSEGQIRTLMAQRSSGCTLAILEGVMGLYDGVRGSDLASSYHLARATQTPILLVVEAQGTALTLAAVIQGLVQFRKDTWIGGVILNGCERKLFTFLRPVLERETGIPVLGHLPKLPASALERRHLGLVTPADAQAASEKLFRVAEQLADCVDLQGIWAVAEHAPPLKYDPQPCQASVERRIRIALARDRAFCFYYEENLSLLTAMGAELVPFSPLSDPELPEGCCGLYLGGGYPELWARTLSENHSLRQSLRRQGGKGLPILAECGGFLYLQQELTDSQGTAWPMVGLLDGRSAPAGKLCRFGYLNLTPVQDTSYLRRGESIAGHEFHYWDSTCLGNACLALHPNGGDGTACCVASGGIFAGFPHLYLPSCPDFARRFVLACRAYERGEGT